MKDILNMIVAGVGGQGVNTICEVLASVCPNHQLIYQGATFKGGAQRLGSIHSEIKIFPAAIPHSDYYSNQIRKGTLDLLIGLEPYEALRYYSFMNSNTRVLVNTSSTPLFVSRYKESAPEDPVRVLKKYCNNIKENDFSALSLNRFGNEKMINYLMLKVCCECGWLPFSVEEITNVFKADVSNFII